MNKNKKDLPTTLIILGATGDLVKRKIVPALFHLYQNDRLPERFRVVGFSRRSWNDKEFQNYVSEILKEHKGNDSAEDKKPGQDFIKLFSYHSGLFENEEDYKTLLGKLNKIDDELKSCSNKLFYLAVPPELLLGIFNALHKSNLTEACSAEGKKAKILVEKPFGKDLKSAEELDELLGNLFDEEQIYRIDHYPAKEMLQNILAFRFSNNLLEPSWNRNYIKKIEIRLLETLGVEDRGAFYDGVGALRDVGQNHLLQMLALVTMEHPGRLEPEVIRAKRAELLKTLQEPSPEEIKKASFRAQYEGYQKIKGVSPDSKTETYFKIQGFLDNPRWQGVPITFESGKRLKEARKEIVIHFKHPRPCMCDPTSPHDFHNQIIFSLEPVVGVDIKFWSKKPGLEMDFEKREFEFRYKEEAGGSQYVEEYAKLILDAVREDQTLFLRTDEIKAMWKFVDPILEAWQKNEVPLETYKSDTDEVLEQSDWEEETPAASSIEKKDIGIIGLGKMGAGFARRLIEKGWTVYGYNRSEEKTKELEKEGLLGIYSPEEFKEKLKKPRIVLLSIPAGKAVEETVNGLADVLEKGDIVIDAGNSFYKDSKKHCDRLKQKGIGFIDAGVSGGPSGARYGASIMAGGDKEVFEKVRPVLSDLAQFGGLEYFPGAGAGHFVKMVHNGIEYGMMQAIAEGFEIMKKSEFNLNLKNVTRIYNNGSVIESRLVGWLLDGFEKYGEDLKEISGAVRHTGEGAWTVETAKEMGLEAKIIEGALEFRKMSKKNPSYAGKILSTLRNMFGGHDIK